MAGEGEYWNYCIKDMNKTTVGTRLTNLSATIFIDQRRLSSFVPWDTLYIQDVPRNMTVGECLECLECLLP